jgi:hypothetical protein
MTKKLIKIVKEEHTIGIKDEVIFKRRDYDFSSEESKKRTEKILYGQRALRKSINYSQIDLEKIYFPRFGPKHY